MHVLKASGPCAGRGAEGETPRSLTPTYLRILLRVNLMCGNFSLKVSFMSFLRSEGFT